MLVVGQLFAQFAFLATEVQSDAGAGNRLFFCSFRPTFALLGAELKSGRGAGAGVCFWQFLATFGPFAQSSNLVLLLVVVLFGDSFLGQPCHSGPDLKSGRGAGGGGCFWQSGGFRETCCRRFVCIFVGSFANLGPVGVSSAFLRGFSPILGQLPFWARSQIWPWCWWWGVFLSKLRFAQKLSAAFRLHFCGAFRQCWANCAILGQISNLAVVLVVGGVFGKVPVFPKVVVGVSSAFLWGFWPIWDPPLPPPVLYYILAHLQLIFILKAFYSAFPLLLRILP